MNSKKPHRIPFSLSTALPLLLIGCGWYTVVAQSHSLEDSTIKTYQKGQLEVVRSAARAAQSYITRELAQRPDAIHQIEQEVLQEFVKPIKIGDMGNAWIYSPNYVIFDDEDFPEVYQGKSMALIFAIQRQQGAWHYESMTQAVIRGQEGVGWYVWQPDLARAQTPWWEPLTQDSGREIAAWSPVVVFSGTPREKIWVVGLSTVLPELMQANGAYAQIQTSIITMSAMTVAALLLMGLLRRSQRELEAGEAHYRAIVEDQIEMICRFRCDGSLTFVNQAYADTFGIKSLKGANVFDLIPQSELSTMLSQLSTLGPGHLVHCSERLIYTSDQNLRWQQWTDRAILNYRGQVIEIQSVGRDITERKLYEAEIERLAFTDPLTGLANRRRLYDVGQRTLNQNNGSQNSGSYSGLNSGLIYTGLIYLDLDRFKPINDSLGHDAGDELLMQVADRLRDCIRQEDILARLGGDEFAILLVESDLNEAEQVAERILVALHQPFYLRGHEIQIGTSLGISTTPSSKMPFSQLLTQADIAMYRAKSQGRGNYVVFNTAMYTEILTRRELETDLRQIIERDQLRVYYQPIISLVNCQVVGVEAVVRWHHPSRGLLLPAEFLNVATELGYGLLIERWVLRQACYQMAKWQQMASLMPRQLGVSVNLSGKYLAQPDLVDSLKALLQETGLAARHLMLEITENIVIEQPELACNTLTQLRQLGVQIALDDFGTGYSSLSYLHRFPVDVLKIDRSFVKAMSRPLQSVHTDEKTGEVVRSIVKLAQSLEICAIAEGIETAEQLTLLRGLQCQAGQGYFFSEPLNPFALEDFLKAHFQQRQKALNHAKLNIKR
jgi:diguanylate cyclase (GGDEF)-like protein/PAS domain S-box-containing protein